MPGREVLSKRPTVSGEREKNRNNNMRLVVLGQGAESDLWKEAARRNSNVSVVASSSNNGGSDLPAALQSVDADAVLVCGSLPDDGIFSHVDPSVAVIVTDPGTLTAGQMADLQSGLSDRLFWAHGYQYARCESAMRRMLDSVGVIGHISCFDSRSIEPPTFAASQWFRYGVGQVESVARLLTTATRSVMARFELDGSYSMTEAFVELGDGSRVQYFGITKPGRPEHSLWIEGSEGSLRTDGRLVWWRKRGWRFFAPVGFSVRNTDVSYDRVLGDVFSIVESGACSGSRNAQSAGLALAGWESDQRRSSVGTVRGDS